MEERESVMMGVVAVQGITGSVRKILVCEIWNYR